MAETSNPDDRPRAHSRRSLKTPLIVVGGIIAIAAAVLVGTQLNKTTVTVNNNPPADQQKAAEPTEKDGKKGSDDPPPGNPNRFVNADAKVDPPKADPTPPKADPVVADPKELVKRAHTLRTKTPPDLDQALKLVDEALTANPKYSAAYAEKGAILRAKGDNAGALEAFKLGSTVSRD
jgi:cell division protein FtsN